MEHSDKRPAKARPAFSAEQRDRLSKLGANAAQIGELERNVIAFGAAWLSASPKVAELRKPIASLRGHATEAAKVLSAMMLAASHGKGYATLGHAGNNVLAAASDRGAWPEKVEALAPAMLELAEWCDAALAHLPTQKRSHAAHWLPVARIWEALVRANGNTRMTVRLSSSPTSPFREVCSICYAAMTGQRDADPERAVKAFIAAMRRRDAAQRAALRGIGATRIDGGPVKPHRLGREPKKKGRLTS